MIVNATCGLSPLHLIPLLKLHLIYILISLMQINGLLVNIRVMSLPGFVPSGCDTARAKLDQVILVTFRDVMLSNAVVGDSKRSREAE
jgi:hypothetical protein